MQVGFFTAGPGIIPAGPPRSHRAGGRLFASGGERIFKDGECVYKTPSTAEIREYCDNQLDTLWDELKRFENPHKYYVDLSQKLWEIKNKLLRQISVDE